MLISIRPPPARASSTVFRIHNNDAVCSLDVRTDGWQNVESLYTERRLATDSVDASRL